MRELSDKELRNIKGGFSIWAFLGSLIAFVFGLGTLEGYVNGTDN